MQIFVDADACPVVDIVETIAEKYNIKTILLVNSNPRIPFVTQESLFVNENPVL